jgi:hypothetical protein
MLAFKHNTIFRVNPDSPLHVPPLCSPQSQDPVLGQHVQTHRVDTLLVDQHESPLLGPIRRLAVCPESLITDLVLQSDDLSKSVIDEFSLGFNELFSLFRRGVEETRVDLAIEEPPRCHNCQLLLV